MNRVLFDTNIYGYLADEPDLVDLKSFLRNSNKLKVCGCSIVRKELRKNSNKPIRDALLELYDFVTKGKDIDVQKKAVTLAKSFHKKAKEIGKEKVKSWKEMEHDMLLIAAATLNNLDVVFSADERTMLGKYCVEAYQIISLQQGLRPPQLLTYKQLRKAYLQ